MSDTGLTGRSVADLRSAVGATWREHNQARVRMLAAFAELDRRGLYGHGPDSLGVRALVDLIQVELNCTRSCARSVAKEVGRFAGRISLQGQALDPSFPVAASALTDGTISFAHAAVIADAVDALPVTVRAEHRTAIETRLTQFATTHDPQAVSELARRIHGHLDPDGPEPVEEGQRRHRRVLISQNYDGTSVLHGVLSAECTAIWHAVLASLSATRATATATGEGNRDSEVDGDPLGPDTRTDWQRMHDAFEQAGRMLLSSERLPRHAGLPAELLITIDLRDLESRVGQATTHHGGTLTVQQALHLAAEATVIPVILDQQLGLIAHGRGRRLASPEQRKALFARDRGCTFPGCAMPAAQSQVHHMLDWLQTGETNPDNLTITCGYHNNEAPRHGWKAHLVNGIPHWVPPPWRDPEQRPRRNYLHHPELLLPT